MRFPANTAKWAGGNEHTSQGALLEDLVVPLLIVPAGGVPASPASWSEIKARYW